MAFPLAVAQVRKGGEAGRVTGMLYGADLVGGCLGSPLGAVLLIPLLDIPNTLCGRGLGRAGMPLRVAVAA